MKPTATSDRFPTVELLDAQGNPTGMTGQLFGRVIDANGVDTDEYAVMLVSGGQGCKHWPAARTEIVEVKA